MIHQKPELQVAFNYSDQLPFPLQKLRENFTLRHSQEKLIELAQSHMETKNFQDAVFFFKKVQDSLPDGSERDAVNKNIDRILDLMEEEKLKKNEKKEADKQQKKEEEASGEQNQKNTQQQPINQTINQYQNQNQNQNQEQNSSSSEPVIEKTKDGVSLKIENISFSGIEVSSGAKIMKMLNHIFNKNLEEEGFETEENESQEQKEPAVKENRVIEEQIFQEVIESRKIRPKELSSNISAEDEAKAIEIYNEKQRELAEKRKNMPLIEEQDSGLFNEMPLIDPETEKFYRKPSKKQKTNVSSSEELNGEGSGEFFGTGEGAGQSEMVGGKGFEGKGVPGEMGNGKKTEGISSNSGSGVGNRTENSTGSTDGTGGNSVSGNGAGSGDGNGSGSSTGISGTQGGSAGGEKGSSENKTSDNLSDKEKMVQKIENSINTGQPLQVQNIMPQQKIQKVNQFNLTYNFQNVFYNKYYIRYSGLFNEAARLVREKKLDEAIDYYQVLLEQKLPETMRLMIQQNVSDLKSTIVNTFKLADTIVEMDASGKLVRLDDINTIRVFEEKEKGINDVFFNETQ